MIGDALVGAGRILLLHEQRRDRSGATQPPGVDIIPSNPPPATRTPPCDDSGKTTAR